MDNAFNTAIESQFNLPLLITMSLSCIIFRYVVRRFLPNPDGPIPDNFDVEPLPLNGIQTYQLLNDIGIGFLTYSGPLFSLLLLYLWNVQNLMDVLDLNLATLDPEVLRFVLGRLRFLIINHELIFGVISNYCRMYDELEDLPINFDPDEFHEFVRDVGNRLLELYTEIGRELNLEDNDLPLHWTED